MDSRVGAKEGYSADPPRLDATELPDPLREYQYVDLRGLLKHHRSSEDRRTEDSEWHAAAADADVLVLMAMKIVSSAKERASGVASGSLQVYASVDKAVSELRKHLKPLASDASQVTIVGRSELQRLSPLD